MLVASAAVGSRCASSVAWGVAVRGMFVVVGALSYVSGVGAISRVVQDYRTVGDYLECEQYYVVCTSTSSTAEWECPALRTRSGRPPPPGGGTGN